MRTRDSKQPDPIYQGCLPYQIKALDSKKKYIAVFGGVGSGKTETGALFTLKKVKEAEPGALGLIAANSYQQLYTASLRSLGRRMSEWGIQPAPLNPPSGKGPFTWRLHNGRGWVDVLCRSLENYELLAGVEIGFAWLDEVYQARQEAWDVVQARLRDKRVQSPQALLTTTPDDPARSWLYDFFITEYNPDLMEVIHASTFANAKHLPEGYVESLKATYSSQMFDRMVLAKWVSLETGRIYTSFDRARNVDGNILLDPAMPIRWSHDFNIASGKPMSSMLAQIKRIQDPHYGVRPELHIFDEIILDTADTNDVIEEFKQRFPAGGKSLEVILYGDASGRARDTRSKTTDYLILAKAGFANQKIPRANPRVRDRHNLVNRLMLSEDGDARLKIHPRCRTLIKGFETARLRPGAGYVEDDDAREQHVTTAAGYLVVVEFPMVRFDANQNKFWK